MRNEAAEQRSALVEHTFKRLYGTRPTVWSRAPGRVDLMGSHTDYNAGLVMTMAIERDTWIAARPRNDTCVRVYSLNVGGGCVFELDDISRAADEASAWSNYLRGMASVLGAAGYSLRGLDAVVHSSVPLGSGLSSSAALEMAAALAFAQIGGFSVDAVEMATLGQRAENEFVGVSCGILDQFSSALGRAGCALLLDCRNLKVKDVRIDDSLAVVICDTGAERRLANTAYDDRRRQCEAGVQIMASVEPRIRALRDVSLADFERLEHLLPPIVARRCRFIVEENARVLEMAEALPRGDQQQLSRLFAASYRGARDGYEIGAPAMEAMIGAMRGARGIVAARQAGAGFGGCMVALVEAALVQRFASDVEMAYVRATSIQPTIYATAAAPGAAVLTL